MADMVVVPGAGPWDGGPLPRGAPQRTSLERERELNRGAARRYYLRKVAAAGGPPPRTYRKREPPGVGGPSR